LGGVRLSRRVTLYTKKGCHSCEEAKELLLGLQREYDLAIREVDIESAKGLEKIYGSLVPVVALEGGRILHSKISESQLRQALGEPVRKAVSSGTTATQIRERERDLVLILNRLILGMANHWLLLLNFAVGLYVGLPVLAPLLMAHGQKGLSNLIYFAYQFVCHQMPLRSFFVAGYQMAMCQ
jgi:glutaredoxin